MKSENPDDKQTLSPEAIKTKGRSFTRGTTKLTTQTTSVSKQTTNVSKKSKSIVEAMETGDTFNNIIDDFKMLGGNLPSPIAEDENEHNTSFYVKAA